MQQHLDQVEFHLHCLREGHQGCLDLVSTAWKWDTYGLPAPSCIHVPGDNDSCETMQNNDCGGSKLSLGLEEESSELSRDLARCWEVEQDNLHITHVQGHLLTNLEF